MPIAKNPKTATLDDAHPVSRTLARAFDDDPMMRWFFPGDSSRTAGLSRYSSS